MMEGAVEVRDIQLLDETEDVDRPEEYITYTVYKPWMIIFSSEFHLTRLTDKLIFFATKKATTEPFCSKSIACFVVPSFLSSDHMYYPCKPNLSLGSHE